MSGVEKKVLSCVFIYASTIAMLLRIKQPLIIKLETCSHENSPLKRLFNHMHPSTGMVCCMFSCYEFAQYSDPDDGYFGMDRAWNRTGSLPCACIVT